MFGIDFTSAPSIPQTESRLGHAAYAELRRLRADDHCAAVLQEHRILTQVAGYHTEVIKFLPPLNITREDLDWFLSAMRKVLNDTLRVPSAPWTTVMTLAKGAVRAKLGVAASV